ncbi:MAG: hypothetical protein Q4A89_04180 [Tannerella sp.]|nr:hypothetical protein [Tannerella sp.]
MQKIIARPVLISKLLNRELDPAILDIAEQAIGDIRGCIGTVASVNERTW